MKLFILTIGLTIDPVTGEPFGRELLVGGTYDVEGVESDEYGDPVYIIDEEYHKIRIPRNMVHSFRD